MRARHLAVILFAVSSAASQELPCSRAIPVNVMLPDGALVRRLPTDAFVARNKKDPIGVQSLTPDAGPRRIVFVVENVKPMPVAARKIESGVILDILANARAEDSFALLSARGRQVKVPFGASRDALQATVEELGNPPQGKNQGDGVLDALLEATTCFPQPQAGDSIILFTMGLESPHKASFSKVRAALAEGRTRVFGFQLGHLLAGYFAPNSIGMAFASGGMFMPTTDTSANRETVFALGISSGGVISEEDTENELRGYKLTDTRLKVLRHQCEQMYKAITEYYLVKLASPSRDLVVELADPIREQLPKPMILYPRLLPDCALDAGVNSNP